MATGTIVKAWKDATDAHVVVSVPEGGVQGVVEYMQVSTPLLDAEGVAKSLAQLKTELAAAVTAQRPGPGPQALAVSGTITV